MTKIAEIQPKGVAKMAIYYDEKASVNPYRVFLHFNELTPYGLMKKRHQLNRYADLASAAYEMTQYAIQNNEERR